MQDIHRTVKGKEASNGEILEMDSDFVVTKSKVSKLFGGFSCGKDRQ